MTTPATLLPLPRSFAERPGSLDLSQGAVIVAGPGLEAQAGLLASWLSRPLHGRVRVYGSSAADGSAAPGAAAVELSLNASFAGKEEYRLEVSAGRASVSASTTDGLARGASTLAQLALSASLDDGRIGACLVEDGPRFPWRGFMLDTARNFFPVDFIEKLIDLAALHRLNTFHWHLTDDQAWRLDLPGMPELAREGSKRLDTRFNVEAWKRGSYSADDVRRVVAFAAARGITVVPEIEAPGHVVALLASHPELSCAAAIAEASGGDLPRFLPEDRYGVFEDILCAGNEEGFALLERVLAGVAGLFPGPYVHVGGDEAPKARWLACRRCRARMAELGFTTASGDPDPEALQTWFTSRLGGILAKYGKRLVGWDEILGNEAARGGFIAGADGAPDGRAFRDSVTGGPGSATLPADAIVQSWRGYSGGLDAAQRGHDVVMSPQTRACYLDHKHLDLPTEPGQLGFCTVRDSYEFEAVPPGLDAQEERHILGGQANLWAELMYFGRQVEYMAFPRLCALSEALWTPRKLRDFDAFAKRLPAHLARLDLLDVNYYRGPLC
jgi:hexosaminidase